MSTSQPITERFLSYVDIQPDGCWHWTSVINDRGYGRFWMNGRFWQAHRAAYVLLVKPIPERMTIDHKCHNTETCQIGKGCPHRRCVNPAHLEPATILVNNRRGLGNARATVASAELRRARTHCKNGHEWSESNTQWRHGNRVCRACRKVIDQAHKARLKALRALKRQVL